MADPDPGSGIWCIFDPWIQDPDPGWEINPEPGSRMGKNPEPGGTSQISFPRAYRETVFWLKYFISLMRIRDLFPLYPGGEIQIRDPV